MVVTAPVCHCPSIQYGSFKPEITKNFRIIHIYQARVNFKFNSHTLYNVILVAISMFSWSWNSLELKRIRFNMGGSWKTKMAAAKPDRPPRWLWTGIQNGGYIKVTKYLVETRNSLSSAHSIGRRPGFSCQSSFFWTAFLFSVCVFEIARKTHQRCVFFIKLN